jgi:hypothetical protein
MVTQFFHLNEIGTWAVRRCSKGVLLKFKQPQFQYQSLSETRVHIWPCRDWRPVSKICTTSCRPMGSQHQGFPISQQRVQSDPNCALSPTCLHEIKITLQFSATFEAVLGARVRCVTNVFKKLFPLQFPCLPDHFLRLKSIGELSPLQRHFFYVRTF